MAYNWLPMANVLVDPAVVQSDIDIPLAGLQTVDGVDLVVDDRVLVRGQANAVQNGVYVAKDGPWERAADFPASMVKLGTRVFVTDGYRPGEYVVTNAVPVLGVSPLNFTSVEGAIFGHLDLHDGQIIQLRNDLQALIAAEGQPNGYASLDANGKVPESQLSATFIVDTFVVASEIEHLALEDVDRGDIAVRTDENKTYSHNGGTTGTMADWTWLRTPTDTVLSVAGRTGAVTLTKSDVGLGNVDNVKQMPIAGGTFAGPVKIEGSAWDDKFKISGLAPSIYFDDTDSESNAYIGLNSGSFFVLKDINKDGVYESPHPLQMALDGSNLRYSGKTVYHEGNAEERPAFAASAADISQSGPGVIAWSTQAVDRGNCFNGIFFTAPVAGLYKFHCHLFVGTPNSNSYLFARFYVNGAPAGPTYHSMTNVTRAYENLDMDYIFSLPVGGSVGVHITGMNGGITYGSGGYSSFTGFLLI